MIWLNTQSGYGTLTKLLHWLVVALFAFQFAAATIMLRLDADATSWVFRRPPTITGTSPLVS